MISGKTLSNSSPLIALEQIGQVGLLERLFGCIAVPPAVVNEVAPTIALPAWITVHPLTQPIGPLILQATLGPGESEAIALALDEEGWKL